MPDKYSNMVDLSSEFEFLTSRSSGPGGQNVNKVNSKVELRFDIPNSRLLNDEQKQKLLTKLTSKLTLDGILIIASQNSRSQLANKEDAIIKFYKLVNTSLKPVKGRKPTQPTRSSIEKRLSGKRIKSETKQYRQKLDF
jgi:ribosome-associated protein